jgi:hypothetical protein
VEHSPELDKVRKLLFPDLTVEEGWERIDTALAGAADPKKVDAIEEIAKGSDLSGELEAAVRRLRERGETPPAA